MLYMQSPFACYMERLLKENPKHVWFDKYGGPDDDNMLDMLSTKGQDAEMKFLKQSKYSAIPRSLIYVYVCANRGRLFVII